MKINTYVDVALLALLGAVVSWLASSLINSDLLLFGNMNIWFDSDMPRVLKNMTVRTEGHQASFKHPLFALLVWPPTALVQMVVGDALTAARVVLAANSALAVALLMSLCARVGVARLDRILAALMFISSCGFLFWFSVPETFAFGATSILIALFAASHAAENSNKGWNGLGWLVAFGLAGLAMTITNFAVFCLALAAGLWVSNPKAGITGVVLRGIKPVAAVLIVAAALSVAQDRLFGDAGLFFNVKALAAETQFIGQSHAAPMGQRPAVLLLAPMLFGAAEPAPFTNNLASGVTEVVKLNMPRYAIIDGVQAVAVTLFVTVLLWGLWAVVKRQQAGQLAGGARATIWAACASTIGFVALHVIYGAEVFLYVAHMLPLLVILLAAGLMAVRVGAEPSGLRQSWTMRGMCCALIGLMALHNSQALIEAHHSAATLNALP